MKTTVVKRQSKTRIVMYGIAGIFLLALLTACTTSASVSEGPSSSTSNPPSGETAGQGTSTPKTSSPETAAPGTSASEAAVPGKVVVSYRGHKELIYSTSWSPDGKWIASVVSDSSVQVWDAKTGKLSWKRDLSGTYQVAWSPNGKYVAVGIRIQGGDAGTGQVYILDAANGETRFLSQKYDFGVEGVTWAPDSSSIAYTVGNGTIEILDIKQNGANNKTYHLSASDNIGAIAWSPNQKFLAWVVTTPGNSQIQVVNIASGETVRVYRGHTDLVNAIAWSPDSEKIASASNDKTVRIWNVANGSTLHVNQEHTDYVVDVAWSTDGKYLASGGTDKTVRVLNIATKSTSFVFRQHTGSIFSVDWSPDSKRIASAGEDHVVHVWQAVKR